MKNFDTKLKIFSTTFSFSVEKIRKKRHFWWNKFGLSQLRKIMGLLATKILSNRKKWLKIFVHFFRIFFSIFEIVPIFLKPYKIEKKIGKNVCG